MNSGSEKELLFGIMALQMSLIRSDQLVAAASTWLAEKSRSLAAILVEQGALSESDRQLLAPLVQRHLQNHGGDPQRSFAALSELGSLAEELRSLGDDSIETCLTLLSDARRDNMHAATAVHESSGAAMGSTTITDRPDVRFRILRSHAKGGLGEVYLAQDTELNREVALKEIQSKFADDEASRLRFLREAEVTGGLEHPGIVPVYGLGRYADGRPFYAMRFIKGDSLQEAADRFHGLERSERGNPIVENSLATPADFSGLEFRKLLGRFIDVCEAIEYAHSRGVLHRDLKPGNIMLGKYGETLVVDWGLAKAQDRDVELGPYDETTLRPVSGGGSAPTMMGSAIGTPSFMSPEQAAGRLNDLGAQSDVYSLGATLYYILTGHAPFRGRDLQVVLQDVQAGNFPSPREVQPSVPKALDAVCRKAMATQAAARYSRPVELAEEIERFLADERVLAYAEPLYLRVRRWLRKHQTLAASSAAAVLVAVVGLVIFSSIVSGKNAELTALNDTLDSRNVELTQLNTTLDDRNELLDSKNVELTAANERASAAAAAAEASAASEHKQRDRAEQALYLSDLRLAAAFLEDGQQVEAMERLLNHYPRREQQSRHGWEWHYLVGRADPSRVSWIASRADIPSLDWSSDGAGLATLDWTGLGAVIWNPETGQPRLNVAEGSSIKLGIDWHPNEDRFAFGAAVADAQVRIFDVKTGTLTQLKEDTGSHRYVRWSPDGQRLAMGGININELPDASNLVVWRKEEGQWRTLSKARVTPGSGVDAVEWSPDGKELLVVGRYSETWVVDPESLQVLRQAPERVIRSASWHPSLPRLACGKSSGEILILDSETMMVVHRIEAHDGDVTTVAWSPDGCCLASGGLDRAVNIWSGDEFERVTRYVGHRGGVSQVCWRPDSQLLASCSTDGRINVWPREQAANPAALASREGVIDGEIKTKPRFEWLDDRTIRVSRTAREIIDWDTRTGEITNRIALSVRGRLLSRTHTYRSSGQGLTVSAIQAGPDNAPADVELTPARFAWPNAYSDHFVAFCKSNGAYQATGGLLVRDLRSNTSVRLGTQPLTRVGDVQWSPDQEWIVAVGGGVPTDGGTIRYGGWINLFNAGTGAMANRSRLGTNRVVALSAAWSPDSQRLAAGNEEGYCQIYEVPGLRTLLRKRIHRHGVQSLSWHPTEDRIASGGRDGKVMVWRPLTGDILLSFDVAAAVDQVAWSPAGRRLAAMDAGGRLSVWDAEPGLQVVQSNRLGLELVDLYSQRMLSSLEYDSRLALEAAQEMLRVGQPVSLEDHCFAALLAALHEDRDTLRGCATLISQDHLNSENLQSASLAAWTLAVIPQALDDYQVLVPAARRMLEAEPKDRQFRLCLALALLRAGRADEAADQLASVDDGQESGRGNPAYLKYVQSIAAHQRGDHSAGRMHLAGAALAQQNAAPRTLFQVLALRLLEKEAWSLDVRSEAAAE